MTELRECPFCGSEPIITKRCGFDDAHCPNKDCELSHTYVGIDLTRKGWQSRPLEDALSARIEELEGQLNDQSNTLNDQCDTTVDLARDICTLSAENARLREALQNIKARWYANEKWEDTAEAMYGIAEEALK